MARSYSAGEGRARGSSNASNKYGSKIDSEWVKMEASEMNYGKLPKKDIDSIIKDAEKRFAETVKESKDGIITVGGKPYNLNDSFTADIFKRESISEAIEDKYDSRSYFAGEPKKPREIYDSEYKSLESGMPSELKSFWNEVGNALEDPDAFYEKDHGNWTIKAFLKEPTKQQAQRELGYYIAEMKNIEDNRLPKVEKLTSKQKAELGGLLARAAAVQGLEMDKDVAMGKYKVPFTDEDLGTEGIPFRYPGVNGWQSDVLDFYLKNIK